MSVQGNSGMPNEGLKQTEPFWLRYAGGLLVLTALMLLFAGTTEIPLLDRDEPRFSQATREMIQRDEWVVPYFNDQYRFDKPVLTYWLMRVPYLLLGTSEGTARIHTVLSGVLLVWFLFYWGRQMFGARAGFLAGLGFLTCIQVMIHGRIAVADMPLILCVTVSHWAIWRILQQAKTSCKSCCASAGGAEVTAGNDSCTGGDCGAFWWLYGSMGVGFLAKGPLAVIVPLLSLLLFRFVFWRKPIAWKTFRPLTGLLVFLVIIAPWGLLALWKTNGLFWGEGMQHHVIDRGIEVFNERKYIFGFYFLTMWASLFPWSPWLLAWARDNFRNMDPTKAFFLSWFIGPFIIFTFYATQLPHYVLPGFPAFFLLLFRTGSLPALGGWGSATTCRLFRWLFRMAAIILVLAAIWINRQFGEASGISLVFMMVAFLVFVALLLAESVYRQKYTMTAITLVGLIVGWWGLGYAMRQNSVVIPMAEALRQTDPDAPAWAVRFNEPSLVFYGNRVWTMFPDEESLLTSIIPYEANSDQAIPALILLQRREIKIDRELGKGIEKWWDRQQEPERVVLSKEELLLNQLTNLLQASGYKKHSYAGMNYARFTWVELELWSKASEVTP